DPSRQVLDLRTTSLIAGVDYVTPALNSIGGQFKYTDGVYDSLQVVGPLLIDNSFREYETSVVAHWMVTAKSTLDGRFGYTSRQYDQIPARDFGGLTWRIAY